MMGLFGPVVFVGLIALVVWAVTRPRPQAYGPPPPAPAQGPLSPMDILQRRFASGEINADEYQKARDLLKGE